MDSYEYCIYGGIWVVIFYLFSMMRAESYQCSNGEMRRRMILMFCCICFSFFQYNFKNSLTCEL